MYEVKFIRGHQFIRIFTSLEEAEIYAKNLAKRSEKIVVICQEGKEVKKVK